MKKIICAVLCMAILCVSIITFATAETVPYSFNYSLRKVSATAAGAPAKANYYSSVLLSLSATFRRASHLTNGGTKYTKTAYKSANGGWGQGTSSVSASVTANNSAEDFVSATATRTVQYYGIR